MKREFAMLMKAHLETGKLPEGGRRKTRSHNMGSSSKGIEGHVSEIRDEVMGGESKRIEKDVNKGKMEAVGANAGVELNSSEVEPIGVEEVSTNLREELLDVSCTESIVVAPNSVCERIGEIVNEMSNTPLRRVTRPALKVHDVEIGSESGVGIAESGGEMASTSTPSKLEMKMSKKVGLDSSSDQIVPTVAGSPNVNSPAQVSTVKRSAQDSLKSRSRMKSQGKLTKKDLGMHRIVFTADVLPDGAALHYVVQGMKRLEGFKKDGGIFCTCCDNVVSASQFEAHAGYASRRKPYDNIFTSNGLSLHKLAIEISRNRESTSKQNDDLCSICEDGGNLLCCKTCPRAFHAECVGLSDIPQETWYCRYCTDMFEKAKFEERSANAIAAGRVPGSDPLKEITQRCIRIVETSIPDIGGCAICSGHDFTKKLFDDRTVIICDQCEKEYHVGCLRDRQMDDLKALPEDDWFCCEQCNNINSTLGKLIEMGEQKLPEALSTIVMKKTEEQVFDVNQEYDIKWRLLKGRGATEATRKFLSDAVSIFHNRFDPIVDSTATSLDLIPHLVYGRPFRGQDYRGMHCAILMVNSVVVSAAIFRVFGGGAAEIPLVATKSECQGKGYFQSLFYCIENLLATLNVKNLVLPAADEAESLWKDRFGFKKLEREEVHEYKKKHQHMMIFQATSILQKSITKSEV